MTDYKKLAKKYKMALQDKKLEFEDVIVFGSQAKGIAENTVI